MRVTLSTPATPLGLGGDKVIEVTVTVKNRLHILIHENYVYTLSLFFNVYLVIFFLFESWLQGKI